MKIALCCCEDYNFGIAYIISYLKNKGEDVRLFFDPRQYAKPYARVIQNERLAKLLSVEDYTISEIKKFNPDITGISCMYATRDWAVNLAEKVKNRLPSTKVVLGGVHPTLCPEDLDYPFIDDLCIGDGVKYFGGKFDPDNLWAERRMFYKVQPPIHRRIQMFMTGFGCPFKCSYCNSPQLHRQIIRRDYQSCIAELMQMKQDGMRYMLLNDDVFTIQKNWLKDFLPEYRKHINVPFTCFGHPKFLDDEIVSMLKDSNCRMIWLGIQSGNEETRHKILNRIETNKEIENSARLIKKHGLKLMIDHIFGIPTESEFSQYCSWRFYRKIKPDVVNCYELLYFPKTEINKYGQGNARYQKEGGEHYKMFVRSFCCIPLGRAFKIFPLWFIKGLVYIKTNRMFIIRMVIENEIFYSWRAIWRRYQRHIKLSRRLKKKLLTGQGRSMEFR